MNARKSLLKRLESCLVALLMLLSCTALSGHTSWALAGTGAPMLTIRRYQLARPGDVDAARHTAQQPEEEPPPETPVAKDGPGQQWTIGRLSSLGNQQTWGAQSVKSIMRQSSELSLWADDDDVIIHFSEPANLIQRIFVTLEHPEYDRVSRVVGVLLVLTILLSCLAFVLGTSPSLRHPPSTCDHPACLPGQRIGTGPLVCTREVCEPQQLDVLGRIEDATNIVFTIDLLTRMVTVFFTPMSRRGKHILPTAPEPPLLRKVLGYYSMPLNIIDVIAVAPFYVHMLRPHFSMDLNAFRFIRLARLFRLLKLVRYSEGWHLVLQTLKRSSPALLILVFLVLVLTTFFGTLIYFFEGGTFKVTEDYPDGNYYRPTANGLSEEVSPFKSILISSYWVVLTATTVGYGDFYPTTAGGRFVSIGCAFAGIIFFAMPMTIIGNYFNQLYEREQERKREVKRLWRMYRKEEKRQRLADSRAGQQPQHQQTQHTGIALDQLFEPPRDEDGDKASNSGAPGLPRRSASSNGLYMLPRQQPQLQQEVIITLVRQQAAALAVLTEQVGRLEESNRAMVAQLSQLTSNGSSKGE